MFKFLLEPGPQGTAGSEAALDNQTNQRTIGLLLCQRKDEVDFCCASACLANFLVEL